MLSIIFTIKATPLGHLTYTMALLRAQQKQIEDLVAKICSGNFSLTDVKVVFMDLREYSDKDLIFREYADFVAHPGRDRGIIKEAIEFFLLKAQFQHEYILGEKILDLTSPFPSYVKGMAKYIVHKIDPAFLAKYNLKRNNFENIVNKEIVLIEGTDLCQLTEKIKERVQKNEMIPELNILYEFLHSQNDPSAVLPEALLDSLVSVLKLNGILFNEQALRGQLDNITILIFAHLHKSSYKMLDNNSFSIKISGMEYRYKQKEDGTTVIMAHHLRLVAHLPMMSLEIEGINVPMELIPTIVASRLPSHLWCAPECFEDFGNQFAGLVDHDFEVKDFKLIPLFPYNGDGVVDVTFNL
ncbi:hypothetical protein DYBT9623_05155 [Dyadobacter sp. CECT 9623]|uniref:Uncharacterized protein n=1 Tax=Dyadobacter linearis TaxID=2823330 RepID=A0ABM8UXY1_9BACT|nr:hypothetical protein [Dyadobacter sp. CECT 9623]CAG5074468.1 hypothetical protein DYBT9623_05155 [Dyadobacter sp. CECT 9623]